jgi:hypothetical protein
MVETPPRPPRYPLKTARTLHTDAEIAQARQNIARYPAARARAEAVIKGADAWLAWDDADLVRLLAPASVPRAFDVGASVGCPKCGLTIHEKFGSYPWVGDLRKPFQLKCPLDGSVYPDNDYAAYLASGFKEKKGWDRPVVDDGWGWLNPKNGERYWFVAHWNHWVWHRNVGPGVPALGLAYLLTGDKRYAHKAAVLLHRIAEVYPAMDHEKQSRYGLLSAARGIRYPGKVLNHIWETAFVTGMAQGYDAIWETLDGDADLQRLTGKSGRDLRAFIEANLLEDAVDAYFSGHIVGNYGMHQNSLAHLAVVRQHGDTEKWIGGLLDGRGAPTAAPAYLGITYALYNMVSRDGVPTESAPGYNFLWVSKLTDVAALLKKGGRDLFAEEPRLRRMYDATMEQVNAAAGNAAGGFIPSWGDSGSVWGDKSTSRSAEVFLAAGRAYGDDRYAQFVTAGGDAFPTYSTLFLPPAAEKVSAAKKTGTAPRRPSRVLDGAGLGILCDPSDRTSATLTYGWKAGHGHFDRLSFELFAAGVPLMPDLGYPDAMNDYVPGIYSWSKNTVSHNTVVVDARRQTGNVPGTLRHFAQGAFARVLDVDATGTYPQATAYRRTLLMVDAGDGDSYLLDVFDVAGGQQHDYSLHGPPGDCAPHGATRWGDPESGTLAGRDVPPGAFYDDPKLAAPGYKGGYSGYTGSGFQHLTEVRRKGAGGDDWFVEWRHAKKPEARLRIRVLPQPNQEVVLARARVSPVKQPEQIGYLIARRTGPAGLESRFVSVIEPMRGRPFIESVRSLPLAEGKGIAVEVKRAGSATDLIIHDPTAAWKRLAWGKGAANSIATDAHTVVLTQSADNRVRRVFLTGGSEGCRLSVGEKIYRAGGCAAEVVAVNAKARTLRIKPTAGKALIAGSVVTLTSGQRRSDAFTVASATRESDGAWTLTTVEDLLVGRAPVKAVAGRTVTAGIALPLAATYAGVALYGDSDLTRPCGIVASATTSGVLNLEAEPSRGALKPGADLWLAVAAPGDRLEMASIYSEEA